jgi:hypothetical protein
VADDVAGKPSGGPCWIRRSLSSLQEALEHQQYRLSRETLRQLLYGQEIRPKCNVKRLEPRQHPDRDQQFLYLQEQRRIFETAGWPIISVDTKSKELIGLFHNPGRVWCSQATAVNAHDFCNDASGRAAPYGIYDIQRNLGYVYVGQSADTPAFAVDAICQWWQTTGSLLYPNALELLILADAGGSNGYLPRAWKQQLQIKIADACGLTVTVCHFPTGASKWNPIEHRLFNEISKTWAGTPLTSFELMLDCIRDTKTAAGLEVQAYLVDQVYEKGQKVSDQEMASLALQKHATCPNWNYTIRPRKSGCYF